MPTLEDLEKRMDTMEKAHIEFKECLKTNTEMTCAIKGDTSELVEIFKAGKGIAKGFVWMGNIAKWFGAIALAIGTLWALGAAIIHGQPPNIK